MARFFQIRRARSPMNQTEKSSSTSHLYSGQRIHTMRIVRSTAWTLALAAAFVGPLQAQTTKMPSTLRWGMGHVDVPSAAVLPHLAIVPTVSGFWVNLDNTPVIDHRGNVIGTAGPLEKFYSDASVTIGLFDRVDVGAVLHSMNDNDVEVG